MSELNTMNKADLKDYAETLGLEIGSRDSVDDIRSKINAHNGVKPDIKSEDLAAHVEKKGGDDKERELTVIFNPGEDGNTSNVFFSINGVAMSLPRNQEVKVKKKYLDMLSKECYGFGVVQKSDPATGKIITKRVKKPTYTFQIVG